MSAVLRASGQHFDVDAFCAGSPLTPCEVYRLGEPKFPASQPNGRRFRESGLHVVVSDVEFTDLELQVRDAIAFLHADEIRRLREFGVDDLVLDFGIEQRDVAAQVDLFPAELVSIAGELGIGLMLTTYPA